MLAYGSEGGRIVNVRLNAEEQRQPVGLAYAVHSQKFQGGEVPIALVMPGMGQTNANSAYSMITRSTHQTHVYVSRDLHGENPLQRLGEAWQQRDLKQSATSRMAEVRRADAERIRREAEKMREYERLQKEAHEREPQRFEPPAQAPTPPMTEEEVNRLDKALREMDEDTERLKSSAPAAAPGCVKNRRTQRRRSKRQGTQHSNNGSSSHLNSHLSSRWTGVAGGACRAESL